MSGAGQTAYVQNVQPGEPLDDREMDVLVRIARGMTMDAIARDTGMSLTSVKTHIRCCYRKLDAKNAPHAVAVAAKTGLLGAIEENTARYSDKLVAAALAEVAQLRSAYVHGVIVRRTGGRKPTGAERDAWWAEVVQRWNLAHPAVCALWRLRDQHATAVAL